MTKSPKQLQQEVTELIVIAPMLPKWRKAISAYHKAIKELEAGSGDVQKPRKVLDKLYKLLDAASIHAGSWNDPAIAVLNKEMGALPKIAAAEDQGRKVRWEQHMAETKRLREEEREANRPYDWIHK